MNIALVITADNEIREEVLPHKDTLQFLQGCVGGLIQVPGYFGERLTMYVNEEGLLMGLPVNKIATWVLGYSLVGDVVIVGADPESGDTVGIPYDVLPDLVESLVRSAIRMDLTYHYHPIDITA